MKKTLQKYGIIFWAWAILIPSVVSLIHIFTSHHQNVYEYALTKKVHSEKLSCELCKMHPHQILGFALDNYYLYKPQELPVHVYGYYKYLSDYQKLAFELRGPPQHISA